MSIFYRVKNKLGKNAKNHSGQVWVILLVGIVGLLVAVKVGRDTGEANIAMTCADNAADTGSLSAASCMATAFNRTVYRNRNSNSAEQAVGLGHGGIFMGHPPFRITGYHEYYYYKEMRLYYEFMRGQYLPFYTASRQYLDDADEFIDDAIGYVTDAKAVVDGLPTLECHIGSAGPACGEWWSPLITDAKSLYLDAADAVHEAALRVGAFNALAAYKGNGTACVETREPETKTDPCGNAVTTCKKTINCDNNPYVPQGLTYWFRENQAAEHLCRAFGYLNQARSEGLKTAQQLAIQNSCYTDKLSDSQRDDFNFWMGGGEGGSMEDGGTGGFNPCGDAHVSYTPAGGGCSIDLTLEIPTIDKYTIRKTEWGFPEDDGNRVRKSIPLACTCDDTILFETTEFHNDPFDYKASRRLANELIAVESYLRNLAARCDTIVFSWTIPGSQCCCCTCGGVDLCGSCTDCGACCKDKPFPQVGCDKEFHATCNYVYYYTEAQRQRECLAENSGLIIEYLTKVVTLGGTNLSIPVLKGWNSQIWTKVWNTPGTKEATDCMSVTCSEADPDNVFFPGMMVINIFDVKLSDETWQTDCVAVSSCGATRHSKSKFCGQGWPCGGKGDLLGAFRDRYEPEITVAD